MRLVEREKVAVIDRTPERRIDIDDPGGEIDCSQVRPDQRAAVEGELALGAVVGAGAIEVELHFLEAHRLQGEARLQTLQATQRRRQNEAFDTRARAAELVALAHRVETDAAERDAVAREHLARETRGVEAVDGSPPDRRAGLPFVRRKGLDHAGHIDAGRHHVGDLVERRRVVLRRGLEAAHRQRGDASPLIAIDDSRGRAERVVRAGQREQDVALVETTSRPAGCARV